MGIVYSFCTNFWRGKFFWFALLINLWNGKLIAQYENLKFLQYNEQQGLSSNNVNCIIQDTEGFIWIGSENGLNKFDGYTFKTYMNNPADSNSIVHNHILLFFIASDSTLWIGTQYGLARYRSYSDDFIQLSDEYDNGYIRGIFEDEDNVIHVVNDRGQIFRIEGSKLYFEQQFNFHVYCFLEDSENNLWFGADEGLYQYNKSLIQPALFRYPAEGNRIQKDVAVFCLLEDEGKIWAGTRGEGIFILDRLSGRVTKFERKLDFIKSLYRDSYGNILVGDTEGLKIFNTKNHHVLDYRPVEHDRKSLASNAVDFIFEDRQANIWLAVKFSGINLAYRDKGFRHIEYESKDPVFITKKTVISLATDDSDNLWLGSYTNGLECINYKRKTSRYIPFGKKEGDLSSGSIYELYNEKDSILWIGTYFGGLQGYNLRTGKITHYNHDPDNPYSIGGNDIRSICEDPDGNFWIITHGKGINKWDRRTNRFYNYRNDPDNPNSLSNDWAFHCMCDSRGIIWVATPFGLSVTRDGTSFENYTHNDGDSASIISNEVFTLFEDSKHDIWIGTRAGLDRFNFDKRNFSHLSVKNGLIDNYICSILEDYHGNLWIATKKGLSKWDRKSGVFLNFDTSDGLQDNEFMENASMISNQGYFYFGSVNRGTWFHPDSLSMNKTIPDVYLTDLKLFNRSVPIERENKNAILRKHLRYTHEIILDHTQKVITFEFTAINFIHPEKNGYAYKLENFDNDWNKVGNKREVTYTNLAAGKYVFRVIASNNDGVWNEEGIGLNITILPPFWRTWWFRSGVSVLLGLTIFLALYFRVQAIKNQTVTLEQTVAIRTQELKMNNEILAKQTNQLNELMIMKDKFFSIIGHDLKNPMNVIRGFTEILSDEFDQLPDAKRKSYLFHISQTVNKTSDLLENLLSWAQSQSGVLTIVPVNTDLCHIVSANCRLFKEHADKKQIHLFDKCPNHAILAYADRNMIETVVRNLLSNAIKFTPVKGTVTVTASISQNEKLAEIVVTDTGIGISPEAVGDLFRIDRSISTAGTSGEIGTGLGLILCREFVEKNGGELMVRSEPGKGSVFTLSLPIATPAINQLHDEQQSVDGPNTTT